MRIIENLNYDWRYSRVFSDEMTGKDYDDSAFFSVNIPHANVELPFNNFDETTSEFISCYRKKFIVKKIQGRFILKFYAVSNTAEVYVNGKFAFSHKGGYTAFSDDVTDHLVEGENVIAVKCDSTERGDVPPFGNVVDYLGYGGIYREVELINVPNAYVKDVKIVCRKPLDPNTRIETAVTMANPLGEDLAITVTAKFGGEIKAQKTENTRGNLVSVNFLIEDAKLWDLNNPNLYDFEISVRAENGETDFVAERFGIRSAEFKKDGFYLNGVHLKLRGLNRHQSYPYVGYAMPKRMQEEDALFLKNELGVNIVRTSHYPQSRHFINKCDEIGLLVFTEAPGWQHIGGDDFKATFKNSVAEMITEYRNHPSIIIWGVRVNESPDDDALYAETNKIAKSLDLTRPTGGVRNFGGSKLLEDVYTYNDFIHNGTNRGLEDPTKIAGISAPYLVTENNGHMFPTKRYDIEIRRAEHALRHATVLNAAYQNKRISGEIGWCMADYNTHKDFGSGDRVCYHGVADMFRIPKLSAAAFRSQSEGEPYLQPSCSMANGDYNQTFIGGFYVYTNLDAVAIYKNGEYVDTYYAKNSPLKYLPHPPIYVPDVIGELIEKDGKYKGAEAKRLRSALRYISAHGFNDAPLGVYVKIGLSLLKHGLSVRDAYDEFGRFLTNWGDKECVYKFVGLKDGKEVIVKEEAAVKEKRYEYNVNAKELIHGDTYDVAEIKITAVSEKGNLLPYCFDAFSLKAEGAVEIIGGNLIAMQGGAVGVYVKTVKKGKGKVTLISEKETKEIEFIVS